MLKPLFTKIVVKRDIPVTTTEAGIVVPEGSQKPMNTGTVVAVGEGHLCTNAPVSSMEVLEDGTLKQTAARRCHVEPLRVKPGDRVLFNQFAGNEVTYTPEGSPTSEEVLIMDQDEVVAIL